MFSYNEVENYVKSISNRLTNHLRTIEDIITVERDKEDHKLPVYLTNWRLKETSSSYFKIKRKNYKTLDRVTDYGGMRVLCLFEQDILPVHTFIIDDIIEKQGYALEEFRVFNWDKEESDKLKNVIQDKNWHNVKIEPDDKDSGYRSIHYVVQIIKDNNLRIEDNNLRIEIQLRTLMQDVWGQLEHKLGYKHGNVHPYIRESFKLLSNDLKTNDKLITNLNKISEQQHTLRVASASNEKPLKFFVYPDNLYPKFCENEQLMSEIKSYESFIKDKIKDEDITEHSWLNNAITKLKKISKNCEINDIRSGYWHSMESAYLDFRGGKVDQALKKYKKIIEDEDYNNIKTYITYFRLGESYGCLGKTLQAMKSFDESENIINKLLTTNSGNNLKIDAYHIKTKLAYIYWEMGQPYYGLALEKITEAKGICDDKDIIDSIKIDDPRVKERLFNALCWYNLEVYIQDRVKNKTCIDDSLEYFKKLEKLIKKNKKNKKNYSCSIQTLDTCAWFCYKKYQYSTCNSQRSKWLNMADNYCDQMLIITSCIDFLDDYSMQNNFLIIKEELKNFNGQ